MSATTAPPTFTPAPAVAPSHYHGEGKHQNSFGDDDATRLAKGQQLHKRQSTDVKNPDPRSNDQPLPKAWRAEIPPDPTWWQRNDQDVGAGLARGLSLDGRGDKRVFNDAIQGAYNRIFSSPEEQAAVRAAKRDRQEALAADIYARNPSRLRYGETTAPPLPGLTLPLSLKRENPFAPVTPIAYWRKQRLTAEDFPVSDARAAAPPMLVNSNNRPRRAKSRYVPRPKRSMRSWRPRMRAPYRRRYSDDDRFMFY